MSSVMPNSSSSLDPLPPVFQRGLIFVLSSGYLSFFASLGLLIYLSFKFFRWYSQGGLQNGGNQFILLLYNLALADLQQAVGFSLTQVWILWNKIDGQSRVCWAQSWFISTGDMASGLWILAIALHTFLAIVKGRRLPPRVFFGVVGGIWAFIYVMAIIPLILHPHDLYNRAIAWCWIDEKYGIERLWLNYLFIFLSMFGTVFLYAITYIVLKVRSHQYPEFKAQSIRRGAKYMLLYPSIYVFATLPLAAGRMAAVSNKTIPDWYYCLAGTAITSCGWLDSLLYNLTRRGLVFSDKPPQAERLGIDTFGLLDRSDSSSGVITTISGPLTRIPVYGLQRHRKLATKIDHRQVMKEGDPHTFHNEITLDEPISGIITTTTTVNIVSREA